LLGGTQGLGRRSHLRSGGERPCVQDNDDPGLTGKTH
jgi:hypothetical protein